MQLALQMSASEFGVLMPAFLQNKIDPDRMTYEQLLELQDQIGYVNTGLSLEAVSSLAQETLTAGAEQCAVC